MRGRHRPVACTAARRLERRPFIDAPFDEVRPASTEAAACANATPMSSGAFTGMETAMNAMSPSYVAGPYYHDRMMTRPFDDSETCIETAYALLRSWTRGLFRFDEHVHSLKFVVAPDGRLVAPVMVAALRTTDTALYIPDDDAPALELLVSLEPFEDEGGRRDGRSMAYPQRIGRGHQLDDHGHRHGEIQRHGDRWRTMIQGNTFAPDEAMLCRSINQLGDEAHRAMCRSRLSVEVEDPVAVAVNPLGVDVNARFDVLRLPFGTPIEDPERVLDIIANWIRG